MERSAVIGVSLKSAIPHSECGIAGRKLVFLMLSEGEFLD